MCFSLKMIIFSIWISDLKDLSSVRILNVKFITSMKRSFPRKKDSPLPGISPSIVSWILPCIQFVVLGFIRVSLASHC